LLEIVRIALHDTEQLGDGVGLEFDLLGFGRIHDRGNASPSFKAPISENKNSRSE
jgi:hypothetical protein